MFFIHFVLIYFIYFIYLILCLLYTGTVDSGGIKLENGKKILDYLYTKNVGGDEHPPTTPSKFV